jgi:hypothetical protein
MYEESLKLYYCEETKAIRAWGTEKIAIKVKQLNGMESQFSNERHLAHGPNLTAIFISHGRQKSKQ